MTWLGIPVSLRLQRSKIIFIEGAEFMIDSETGVTPFAAYDLKKIDPDSFARGVVPK
jgi:restriction endonuclease Mrr